MPQCRSPSEEVGVSWWLSEKTCDHTSTTPSTTDGRGAPTVQPVAEKTLCGSCAKWDSSWEGRSCAELSPQVQGEPSPLLAD